MNILKHQFLNCLHRLKLAIEDGFLIPGGGIAEAVCVSKLRHKLHELNCDLGQTDLNSPHRLKTSFAMATSWMGDPSLLVCWKPLVYEVCADGLMQYIARVFINCSCSGAVGQYAAMTAAEELVKKVEGGDREEGMGTVDHPKVLDVAKSKVAAWRRAVSLLRLIFLSQRVQMH